MSPYTAPQASGRSLTDLRSAAPADSTFDNLLTLLRAELDLCAQLPLFEYEAVSEGHDECAGELKALAERERTNCARLLSTLRRHLDRMSGEPPPEAAS